jgi:CRISPR-associated endonuclease/helicase Cas3
VNRFALTDDEASEPEVRRRLHAAKTLYLRSGTLDDIISIALSHAETQRRVLVYVCLPKDAETIARALGQKVGLDRIAILTGTIRGHERDEMTTRPLDQIGEPQVRRQAIVFREFRTNYDRRPPEKSEYLVATSAGEVGIDLDADEIVCDLTYLDSMIQRFGRLNRLGRTNSTAWVIELPPKRPEKADERLTATKQSLLALPLAGENGHDASPMALQALTSRDDAFSQTPRTLPLTDVLLDNWSLTRTPELSPPVERYLHGIMPEPPDLYVAWREEVPDLIAGPPEAIVEWLDTHSILSREQVRGNFSDVLAELRKISRREERALVIPEDEAGVQIIELSQFNKDIQALSDQYRNALIVLPPTAGGLNRQGILDGNVAEYIEDVADEPTPPKFENRRLRIMIKRQGRDWSYEILATDSEIRLIISVPNLSLALRQIRQQFPAAYEKETIVLGSDDEGNPTKAIMSLVYRQSTETVMDSSAAPVAQELDQHLQWTAEEAESITRRLDLPSTVASAIVLAARTHDLGKNRAAWQKAIGHPPNGDDWKPWAKSSSRAYDWSVVGQYRHEFGSLREAITLTEIKGHSEADLVLHLIACHHGWARPHYEQKHVDIADDVSDEKNQRIADETVRRFARLQRKCGHWYLAWLESLLRCSDYSASRRLNVENHK